MNFPLSLCDVAAKLNGFYRALLVSLALHIVVASVWLLTWPIEEEASAKIVPITVVARSNPRESEANPQSSQSPPTGPQKSQGALKASSKRTTPAPKPRNGLLKSDSDEPFFSEGPGTPAGKADNFFASAGELKMPEPNLANSDRHERLAWKAEVNRDGSVKLSDNIPLGVPDVTDLIMRLRGETLYDPEKRDYLKETKEARQIQSHEYTKANHQRALNELGSRLTKIWQNDALSADQKRQRIFDIWDECAEEGSDDMMMMSHMVRQSVQTFVSRNIPKGSEHSFSDDELARLNQGRISKAEFKPYS